MSEETQAHQPDLPLTTTITGPPTDSQESVAADQYASTRVQTPQEAAQAACASRHDHGWSLQIPGYEIERELGHGAMGVVYAARQIGLNRVVALKMLLTGLQGSEIARARFQLEAEAVAALEHPHIVRVFAFGEHEGHPYLAMEYLPGGTLADQLGGQTPRPIRDTAELIAVLAAATAHAHARGVVHRDIKPANVLLTEAGEVRLADFGLAKLMDPAGGIQNAARAVEGTPAYMSPEQAQGETKVIGPPADVWALGVILYEMLTGNRPFQGNTRELLASIGTVPVVSPRTVVQSIPRDLEMICLKCLANAPTERYPTAKELADDLGRFLRGEPIQARSTGTAERALKWVRRNKVAAGAVIAVTLSLVVGSTIAVWFGIQASRDAELARTEHARAENEATEARRLENEVRVALGRSETFSKQRDAALTQTSQLSALNYLAYGQLCATAAKIATASNRRSADEHVRDYPRIAEWLSGSADPAVKEAIEAFTEEMREWSAGPPPAALRQQSLKLALACRKFWLEKDIKKDFPDLVEQIRARLYTRACAAATGLLSPTERDRSRMEFWELYWGELVMVESQAVLQAMVKLGELLKDMGTTPVALEQAVAELHLACGRPFVRGK